METPVANEQEFVDGEEYKDPNVQTETVFVDTPPQPKRVAQKLTNGVNQALSTIGTKQDTVQAFTDGYLNGDGPSMIANTDQHVVESTKRITGLAGKVDPKAIAKTVKKRVDEANDGTLLGKYKAAIRSNPVSEKLTDSEIGEAASSAYLHDLMAQVHDSTTPSERMTDFVQTVLLSTDNYKMKELADYFGLPFEAGDALYKGDFVRKFADTVRKMPVESKAHIYKKIVDNWETMGGFANKAELISFLGRLEAMDDFENTMMDVENIGDVAGAAGIITAGVSKVAGGVANGLTALTGLSKVTKGSDIAIKAAAITEAAVKTNSNLIRVAQLKDVDAIADVVQAGARGELKLAGVDPLEAANAMSPFDSVKQLTPGAPKAVAHSILERQKVFDEITNSETLALPISESERMFQIDKIMAKVEAQEEVASVKLLESDGKKFTIEYTTNLGGEVKQTHEFKLSDVGVWEDLRYRHAGMLGSPKFKFPGIADDLVDLPQFGMYQGAKLKRQFAAQLEQAFKGANGEKVMDLVKAGEQAKTVYSFNDAVNVGVNGIKLAPKDYEAYATVRQAFDAAKKLKEKEILEGWRLRNIKHYELNGEKHAGKVYETEADAIQSFNKSNPHSNWFIKDGKMSSGDLTPDLIKKAYGNGYKLVRANALQLYKSGGHAAEWVLTKADKIFSPVGPIINDIPGYVTRINQNANFFLKKLETIKIGDKQVQQWVTMAYDDVFTDLDTYRKAKFGEDANFRVFSDRELSAADLEDDVVSSMGGLFTGARSSTPIPFGPGKVAKQAPIMESLQRYIEHVATHQPMAIYREGLKQKWINTAVKNGVIPGYKGTEPFSSLGGMLNPKNDKYFFFKRSFDEITSLTGIRTKAEMEMESRMTQVGKWFEDVAIIGKPVARFFHNGKVQDVGNALASATYHSMLGLYNMAQSFIQFSGSIVPLASNPVSGMKGLYGAMELTVLDYMANFGKINGMPTKKVDMNMWELWRESGLGDAIKYSNMDFAMSASGAPYDAGMFKKLISNSDVLTLMGEQGYSRVAFGTAYHHVAAELGRVPQIGDLPKITARADQYKLNMGRANAAGFQKDAIAKWPGMFMQAQTKFAEKMLGSDFTKLEKTRIIGAQIALYGAMGTPFVGSIAPQILSAMGVDVSSTDTDTLSKIHKGIFGWLMSDYLELHADVAGRLSLGTDFVEKSINMVFSDSHPIDAIGGARWGFIKNSCSALEKLAMTTKVLYNYDHITPALALSAAEVMAEEALSIPSSTRNIIKGYTMYNSQLYKDKSGLPVFYYRDPSLKAAITQAIGFQNEEVNDWYTVADGGQVFSKSSVSSSYAKMMAGLITKFIEADADKADAYAMAYNAMASAALNQKGGDKVLEQCIKALKNPKETWNSKFIKGMERYQTEYSEGYEEWMKILNVRSSLAVGRELEKYGVEK